MNDREKLNEHTAKACRTFKLLLENEFSNPPLLLEPSKRASMLFSCTVNDLGDPRGCVSVLSSVFHFRGSPSLMIIHFMYVYMHMVVLLFFMQDCVFVLLDRETFEHLAEINGYSCTLADLSESTAMVIFVESAHLA